MHKRDQPKYQYLLIGGHGFLGRHVESVLSSIHRSTYVLPRHIRLCQSDVIKQTIESTGAKFVVCAAGVSGKPTVQWCEDHELETFETNVLDVCNLIRICRDAGVHLTYFGSGLVYARKDSNEAARCEVDEPNLTSMVYCRYRVMLESIIRRCYITDVLYLRILYPCSFDGDAKCFFEKMMGRSTSVKDARVSLTIIPDLFPLIPKMVEDGRTGIVNFVNRGSVHLKHLFQASMTPFKLAGRNNNKVNEELTANLLCDFVGLENVPFAEHSVHSKISKKLSGEVFQKNNGSHWR